MKSLRRKLAFSYGLLIVFTLAVSAWGIYHLVHLGRAVDVILVNNYKSILAAENMKEALERIDSSAMFFVASHADKARQQFTENAKRYADELQVAASNVTEPGEEQIIADISTQYAAYQQQIERFIHPPRVTSTAEQSATYFARLEPAFLALKARLDDLLRLLLGGRSVKEGVGTTDYGILVVEPDGTVDKNDTLKVAGAGADRF